MGKNYTYVPVPPGLVVIDEGRNVAHHVFGMRFVDCQGQETATEIMWSEMNWEEISEEGFRLEYDNSISGIRIV